MATPDEMRAEAAETPPAEWDVFMILPNLNPRVPSPFQTKYMCVCSGRDPLMKSVVASPANQTGLDMMYQYRTWFDRSYMPGCLLVHKDAPADRVHTSDALRGFRDICALASVTNAIATKLNGGQWEATYTDFFEFAPHIAGKSGWIGKMDGIVQGMNDEVERFSGQCSGQVDLPHGFTQGVDEVLFKRLANAWDWHYVAMKDDAFLKLFRSLDIAFQAGHFPSDGLTGIHDMGMKIGLWVSAFEVLCHPGSGSVNKKVVHDFLSKAKLSHKKLTVPVAKVTWGRDEDKVTYEVGLLGLIYEDLYKARNKFMHGNQVKGSDLYFRQNVKRPHLYALAPLVYNIALRTFTELWFPSDENDERHDFFLGLGEIEKALLTALTDAQEID